MRERGIDALKKTVIMIIGTFGVGVAMACTIRADLTAHWGADPMTLLMNTVGEFLGKDPGFGVNVVNFSLLLFMLIFNRRLIYFGTIITTFLMGVFTNVGTWILNLFVPENPGIFGNLALLFFGVVLLGASIGFYISLDFGVSAVDGAVLTVQKWEGRSYKVANWTVYLIALVISMLMGGLPGFGTIVGLVLPGIVVEPINKYLSVNWPRILKFQDKPKRRAKHLEQAAEAENSTGLEEGTDTPKEEGSAE